VIDVKGLRHRYGPGDDWVLRGVDLTIPTGASVGMVGSNGSGKSTLAKHLNALLVPEEGDVVVDGRSARSAADVPAIRQSVGMVFQNPDNQIVATIVEDDVAFGPENLGLDGDEIGRRVEWALGLTGMTEYRLRSPSTLSGGQRQRLAIASVLAMRPRHIVFDEPTSMLDPVGRAEVQTVMDTLRDELGISVIHITHHMEELLHLDGVVALEAGRVVFTGPPAAFFADRRLLERLGLRKPPLLVMAEQLCRAGVLPDDFLPTTVGSLCERLLAGRFES